MVDSNNTVVWRAEYASFGQADIQDDPDGNSNAVTYNMRFPGQYYDGESGLHYNYFRDYDPGIGRYITSDPIGLAGGINTYVYVENNPLNFTDPLGLKGGFNNPGTGGQYLPRTPMPSSGGPMSRQNRLNDILQNIPEPCQFRGACQSKLVCIYECQGNGNNQCDANGPQTTTQFQPGQGCRATFCYWVN